MSPWPRGEAFVLRRSRWTIATVAVTFEVLAYAIPNHYPLAHAVRLPFTWLDREIPFLPWSVWLYGSEYLLVLVAFMVCRREDLFRFVRGFTLTVSSAAAVQLLFPVEYPRDAYPVPLGSFDAGVRLLSLLREADTPASCFPSMHVALAVFVAAAAERGRGRWRQPLAGWAALAVLSTLTLKQHYVIDVLAGAALGLMVFHGSFDARRGPALHLTPAR